MRWKLIREARSTAYVTSIPAISISSERNPINGVNLKSMERAAQGAALFVFQLVGAGEKASGVFELHILGIHRFELFAVPTVFFIVFRRGVLAEGAFQSLLLFFKLGDRLLEIADALFSLRDLFSLFCTVDDRLGRNRIS